MRSDAELEATRGSAPGLPSGWRAPWLLAVPARLAAGATLSAGFFAPVSLAGVQLSFVAAGLALLLAAALGRRVARRTPLDGALLLAAAAMLVAAAVAPLAGVAPGPLDGTLRWRPILAPLVLVPALGLSAPGEPAGGEKRRAVAALLAWCAGASLASLNGMGQALLGVDAYAHVMGRPPVLARVAVSPGVYASGLHAATGFAWAYGQFAHQLCAPVLLAAALAAAAPLGRLRRALLGGGAALAAAGLVLTSSRAAWAGLCLGAGVAAVLLGLPALRRLPRAARALVPLGLAAALVAPALAIPGLRARLLHLDAPGVNDDRGMIWAACAVLRDEHPLGVGPGAVPRELDRVFQTLAPQAEIRTGCHSMALELLAEGGPLLLVSWAIAGLWVLVAFGRALRERGRAGDARGRAAAAGALAALASWSVNGLFMDLHRESRATWALALTLAVAAVLAFPRPQVGGALRSVPAAP